MAIDIGELRGLISLQDNFSKPVDEAAKGLGAFSESFGAVSKAVGLGVGAITAAAGAVVALGQRGAVVGDVKDHFEGLTAAAGSSADVMLGALQQGTVGTVTNFELMKLANKALGTGLIKTSEDMQTAAEGARLLAKRTGGDTVAAFETLTGALASGRTASLKQLGIFVDSKSAIEDYARALGIAAGDLNDTQRAQALSTAAMEALRGQLQAFPPDAKDFGEIIDAAKVHLGNFVDNLSLAVAQSPVVRVAMETMGTAFAKAFGGDQQQAVRTLMGYVNEFAIGLTHAADIGIEAARFLTHTWNGLKIVFDFVMVGIFENLTLAAGKFASMAEMGAKIPGIGGHLEGLAGTLRGVATSIGAARDSFMTQTEEAIDNAVAQEAAFQKAHGAVADLRTAMVAASEAQVEVSASSDRTTTSLGAAGAAAGLTAEQIAKLAEEARKASEAAEEHAARVAAAHQQLQLDITLATQTGLAQRLTEIETAYAAEIEKARKLAAGNVAEFEAMAVQIDEKYRRISSAAVLSYAQQAASAVGANLTQVEQAQLTLDNAKKAYDEIKAAGVGSYAAIETARKAVGDAEQAVATAVKEQAIDNFLGIASSASSILRSLFGKNKAAAIAATLIDAAAAIVKAFAQGGILGFASAAAIAAATGAQIAKIKSAKPDGFAEGTPGTAFVDFGRESITALHGREAVVNESQGASLAGMVEDAIRSGGRGAADPAMLKELRGLRSDIRADLPFILRNALRDPVALGR